MGLGNSELPCASTMGLTDFIFPDEPRALPGRRWLKIGLRAVHVVFACGFLGSFVFEGGLAARPPWATGVVASGMVLLLLDLHESAAVLLQVRGFVVAFKIALLIALPWLGSAAQLGAVIAIVAVSVLSSHAPGKVRYYLVVGRGRIRGSDSMG